MRQSRKLLAVDLLASGYPVSEVADAVHVSRQTVYNWMSDPEYTRQITDKRSEVMQSISARLISISSDAVDFLGHCVRGDFTDPHASIRLRASALALGRLREIVDLADIEDRIRRLEEVILHE